MDGSAPTLFAESRVLLAVEVAWQVELLAGKTLPEKIDLTKLSWTLLVSTLNKVELPAAF